MHIYTLVNQEMNLASNYEIMQRRKLFQAVVFFDKKMVYDIQQFEKPKFKVTDPPSPIVINNSKGEFP